MTNVGIITLHYPYNYGSVLQAYAMQKILNKIGYESEIINYICDYDFENYKLFRFKQYIRRPKTFLSDLFYLKKNLKRRKAFKNFDNSYLKITEKKYKGIKELKKLNNSMDAFIAGSDQIWNFECTGGVDPAYFLKFVQSEKKIISYAPSMGQGKQKQKYLEIIRPMLKRFNALSIREKSMRNELENLTDQKFNVVLDPTLLLNANDYSNLIADKNGGKYIFVYMLEPNDNLIEYAINIAKKNKMKIIYISNITKKKIFNTVESKDIYGISPNQFLSEIYGAEYVITNSFHATVFSIIFEKKFITFKTKKSFPRMLDLLNSLGLNDRVNNLNSNIDDSIDFISVKNKLKLLRHESISFLKDSLS